MLKKRRRGRPPHDDVLTPAEWRVTHAIQHGLTTRTIAKSRGISRDGVKYHVAQILGKLHLPDRQALRHWFSAPKDSALARSQTPAAREETLMKPTSGFGPLGQIGRSVKDIQVAERWYRDVLKLPHLYTFGTLAFFDCGGTRLMLTQESSNSPAAESILYFRVSDIRASQESLQAQGVEFINAPHMIHRHADGTEEWMAFFKDPDGRPLAIMSAVPAP
jgi:DNA-binding CsgD family transcriptional regulator/catechol 2,3-dioxygenase-like lactoylglutathione lyase family enzyme